MNFILKIVCCLSLLPTAYAQTLEDYLKEASQNNPGLRASYAGFKSAMEQTAQANALPDPNLSIGYFIQPVETRVGPQLVKLSISQMFPWFGSLKAKGTVATKTAEAKYQEFLNQRNLLFSQIKEAYYNIYEAQEHIRLQKEILQIIELYKKITTDKYANTQASILNVLRAQIMRDDLNTKIDILQDNLASLRACFNSLLNKEPQAEVNVFQVKNAPDDIFLLSQYRKDSLLVESPQLKTMSFKIEAAENSEKFSVKNGLPKFGVGVDYVFVGRGEMPGVSSHNVLMPMLSASIPIFRKKYSASVREIRFATEALKSQKTNLANQLTEQYETIVNQVKAAIKNHRLYTGQIKTAQIIIDLLYTEYSNSGQDFEELLRAQQQLLDYEISRATAVKNFYIAMARLDYITSKSL